MFRQHLRRSGGVNLLFVLLAAFALGAAALTPGPVAAQFDEGVCGDHGSLDHPTVYPGDTGEAVEHAQCLITWGNFDFGVIEDGVYGPETQGAIEAIQLDAGLEADGIIGQCTWAVLHGAPPGGDCF